MENDVFTVCIVAAYILGSIPFSYILTRVFLGKDIRKVGSHNVGATNVFRVNRVLSFFVLVLDVLKSYIVIFLSQKYGSITIEGQYVIGLFSVIGHTFPVWLMFRGGKGVATVVGVLLALNYYMLISFIASWIAVFFITRYASAASLVAVTTSLIVCMITETTFDCAVYIVIATIITARHWKNIIRIIKKEEMKL